MLTLVNAPITILFASERCFQQMGTRPAMVLNCTQIVAVLDQWVTPVQSDKFVFLASQDALEVMLETESVSGR